MPALTHGRVVNGFNAYSMTYERKLMDNYKERSAPYNCNSKCTNSNKSSTPCNDKYIYVPTGKIIPLKYQKSNSCTSQKCRRVRYKDSKLGLSKNVYQRGIGESIQRNLLNRKNRNKCNLQHNYNNKKFTNPGLKNLSLCKCFKLF